MSKARLSGIRTHYGEILSEHAEMELDLTDIGLLLATTSNDAYNAFVCSRFAHDLGRNHVFQIPMHIADEREKKSIKLAHRGIVIMGPKATNEELERRHYFKWQFKKTRFTQTFSFENYLQIEPDDAVMVLLLRSDGEVLFHSVEFPLKPEEGDILLSYVPPPPVQ